MSDTSTTLLVSICTYQRTQLLKELLDSLQYAKDLAAFNISFIVVDNDSARSAESLCLDYSSENDLVYVSEPKRNIATVRNVGLQHAINKDFDYILFLDDDEFVCKTYFSEIQKVISTSDPDVLIGPVITLYHSDTPSWAMTSKAFERTRKVTGSKVNTGNTGNALVKISAIGDIGLFNPEYGRSGGEDSEFFYRCQSNGLSMIWCDEAEVYEYLELERCSLKYLITRAKRGGQTYSKIRRTDLNVIQKITLVTKSVVIGLPSLCIASILISFSAKKKGVPLLKRSIAKISQIEGLFGKSVKMYGE